MDKLPRGTRGGRKQLWLKQHKPEIKAYYYRFGVEETCREFNMKEETLEKLINSPNPLNRKDDRALIIAKMADDRSVDAKKRVSKLEKDYSLFVETVIKQLEKRFFEPLIRNGIQVPKELEVCEEKNLLDITDLDDNIEAKR